MKSISRTLPFREIDKPKPIEFEEWRYYGHWGTPAWAHKCGPRGGAAAPIWVRKRAPLKTCPRCASEVPDALQMHIKLQKLNNLR